MTGNKQVLSVYLGKHIIAQLFWVEDNLYWKYSDYWQQAGYPISPHLPFKEEIPSLNIQRFLRNLLPEGAAFEELIETFHLSRYNTFGLMRALGLDTPGSLIILPSEHAFPKETTFRPISKQELEKRLDERDHFSLIIWDGKPRLSVAGIQDKINVVLNEDNKLGFGEGGLCSTHILKFEKQKLSHLVLNEYISMQLANACGLSVAETSLMRFGKHPALLVKRFDRNFISITEVKRRHIIDACQALNLPPDYKYERNFGNGRDVAHIRDGVNLVSLFEFTNKCRNPALAKQQLLDWVLFNILIFNYDAHGKNVSFYVSRDGISLAPFYDLVNIKMYPAFEHDLAMALGNEFDGNNIHGYQLADFSDSCHLPRLLITNRLQYLCKKLMPALQRWHLALLNEAELSYLNQYRKIINQRCKHLLKEIQDITSIKI